MILVRTNVPLLFFCSPAASGLNPRGDPQNARTTLGVTLISMMVATSWTT